jgi:UDP-GlcNAc:undecaprenyl-phosphate GlcNAc-1-phosphate transferase
MTTDLRLLLAGLAAFLLAYALTPQAARLAERLGLVKYPGGRHLHTKPTPLLGGLALFAGIYIPGVLAAPDMALAICLPLALISGLVDDWCKCKGLELPALPKLILQFLPAVSFVFLGRTIMYLSNPFGGGLIVLPVWLDWGLTIAWLVGMTNAVNFLDGMDGLLAGVTAVASFSLMVIALIKQVPFTASWMVAIFGASLAFLRYNFPPAKLFMGDTGSNFLGFTLAALAVSGYFKAATLAGLVAPLLALFIPLFNVVFVILRRMRQGRSFVEALTVADLEHSFNVLGRRTGFNTMETVLVFILMGMMVSAVGVAWAGR